MGPVRRDEFRPVMVTSDGRRQDSEDSQGYSSLSFGSLASKKIGRFLISPHLSVSHVHTLSGSLKESSSCPSPIEQLFTSSSKWWSSACTRSEGTEERNRREKLRNLSLSSIANAASPVSSFLSWTILDNSSLTDARPLSSLLPGDYL